MTFSVFLDWNDRSDFFSRLKLQQVDDRSSSRSSARFRNLISLHSVHTTSVCKEHHVMMGRCHQKFLDVIFIDCLHSLDSLAATVLGTEIIKAHSLDIAKFCHCDHSVGYRNEILHGNIILVKSDGSSSLITVFFCDQEDFLTDNTKEFFLICQNCF